MKLLYIDGADVELDDEPDDDGKAVAALEAFLALTRPIACATRGILDVDKPEEL